MASTAGRGTASSTAQPDAFRVDGTFVRPPRSRPHGVVHFLGGAFVGSAPDLTVGSAPVYFWRHRRAARMHEQPEKRSWNQPAAAGPLLLICAALKCSTRC